MDLADVDPAILEDVLLVKLKVDEIRTKSGDLVAVPIAQMGVTQAAIDAVCALYRSEGLDAHVRGGSLVVRPRA